MDKVLSTAVPGLSHYDAPQVLALLQENTYEQVQVLTNWSRGKIWALAKKMGARKTESKILERHSERRQRQLDELASMINQTVKSDVLDFLDGIPDNSVKLHFTSPPYNVGKKYGAGGSADVMRFTYFHGWLMQVISEMSRTLKDGGVLCINVGKTYDWTDHLMPLDVLIFEDLRRSGLTFQSRVIWTAPHGLTPTGRLADRYETILVFSKGEKPTFNPNSARVPQKYPSKRAYKGPNKGELSGNPFGAAPSDVWADIPTVRHSHPERALGSHPAQFPVGLAKRAILLYTMPGDLICDPFSGSGTTAVASIETGRDFVGADLFYEELRRARTAGAVPDQFSELPGVTDESIAIWQAEARKVELNAKTMTDSEDLALCGQFELCI